MTPRLIAPAAAALFILASAVANAQPAPAQEVEKACAADVAKLCPGVQPGGGKIAECLKAQKAQVSMGCKMALMRAHKAKQAAAGQ